MTSTRSVDAGTGLDTDAIVGFILGQPGMLRRLLTLHVKDDSGLCEVCSTAGTRHVWPCRIRGYASLALRHRRREGARRASERREQP